METSKSQHLVICVAVTSLCNINTKVKAILQPCCAEEGCSARKTQFKKHVAHIRMETQESSGI